MTTTVLQISDPHFGTEQAPVALALIALVKEISPDVLVLSGDITQRARASEFRAAAAFVGQLGIARVLAIPGNHDIPLFNLIARVFSPYAGFRDAFGAELEPSYATSDCLILSVKTTRRYRHVDGEISTEQLERVAQRLRAAEPQQARVVVLHQPIAVPRASERKNLVHGHEAAVECWAEAGADIILAGHIHLPFVLPLHEVKPGLPRHLWAVNAGTAVSSRVRHDAGNSVNILRFTASAVSTCSVEHWGYSTEIGCFIQSAKVSIPLGPR